MKVLRDLSFNSSATSGLDIKRKRIRFVTIFRHVSLTRQILEMNVGTAALIAGDCLAYDLRNETALTSLFNTIVADTAPKLYSALLMSAARSRGLKLNEKFMTDG